MGGWVAGTWRGEPGAAGWTGGRAASVRRARAARQAQARRGPRRVGSERRLRPGHHHGARTHEDEHRRPDARLGVAVPRRRRRLGVGRLRLWAKWPRHRHQRQQACAEDGNAHPGEGASARRGKRGRRRQHGEQTAAAGWRPEGASRPRAPSSRKVTVWGVYRKRVEGSRLDLSRAAAAAGLRRGAIGPASASARRQRRAAAAAGRRRSANGAAWRSDTAGVLAAPCVTCDSRALSRSCASEFRSGAR